jgi:hypothetical protein
MREIAEFIAVLSCALFTGASVCCTARAEMGYTSLDSDQP